MYHEDASTTYAAARAFRLEREATRRRLAAEQAERGNRRATCPRCRRAWPEPCRDKGKDGEWVDLDVCHPVRAQRRMQGW